jgi:hypothetical protein
MTRTATAFEKEQLQERFAYDLMKEKTTIPREGSLIIFLVYSVVLYLLLAYHNY